MSRIVNFVMPTVLLGGWANITKCVEERFSVMIIAFLILFFMKSQRGPNISSMRER